MSSVFLALSLLFIIILFRQDSKEWASFSIELWILLLWLVFSSTRLLNILFPSGRVYNASEILDANIQGNPINRIIYFALILGGLLILIKKRHDYSFPVKTNFWLFTLYFLLLCSTAWSDFIGASFRKWIRLFGSLIMAMMLVTEKNVGEAFEHVFRRFSCIVITISVLLVKYYPAIGFVQGRQGTRNWAGVAAHRNELGVLCAFALIFLVWRFFKLTKKINIFDATLAILGVYLLTRSGSATAIVVFFMGLVLLIGIMILKNNPKKIVLLISFSALAFSLILVLLVSSSGQSSFDFLFRLVGREASFTGRLPMWTDLIEMGSKDWLVGAGYESFWPANLMRIWEMHSFGPTNAHNGYIDVYLNLGLVGLIIFLIFIVKASKRYSAQMKTLESYRGLLLIYFVLILICNLTESSFIIPSFLWFILLISSIHIEKHPVGIEEENEEN